MSSRDRDGWNLKSAIHFERGNGGSGKPTYQLGAQDSKDSPINKPQQSTVEKPARFIFGTDEWINKLRRHGNVPPHVQRRNSPYAANYWKQAAMRGSIKLAKDEKRSKLPLTARLWWRWVNWRHRVQSQQRHHKRAAEAPTADPNPTDKQIRGKQMKRENPGAYDPNNAEYEWHYLLVTEKHHVKADCVDDGIAALRRHYREELKDRAATIYIKIMVLDGPREDEYDIKGGLPVYRDWDDGGMVKIGYGSASQRLWADMRRRAGIDPISKAEHELLKNRWRKHNA